jgi:putative acetyltransferase
MIVRYEKTADEDAIGQITEEAFADAPHSDGSEAAIIGRLRDAGGLTVSLVAEKDGVIVGHVAFSPITIDGQDQGWLGLGPVAVRPDHQGQGIGRALINKGLDEIKAKGVIGCVVLGDPNYYQRFGFVSDAGLSFEGPPPEYFMAQAWSGDMPTGAVVYHAAFYQTQ